MKHIEISVAILFGVMSAVACDVETREAESRRAGVLDALTDDDLEDLCTQVLDDEIFEAQGMVSPATAEDAPSTDASTPDATPTDASTPDASTPDATPTDALAPAPPSPDAAANCLWDCMDPCVTAFGICSEANPLAMPHVCMEPFRDCRRACLEFPCPI